MGKKKILIVEDEPDVSKVLSKGLLTAGYEVLGVRDAVMVLQEVRAFKPDLIVLDLMLPGGGGLLVLENLRRIPANQNIPVVVLTGMKNEEYKKKVMTAGVDAYMEKPYEFEDFLSKVRGTLHD